MPKRRTNIEPDRLLYDIDVELQYDLLGKRVGAQQYVLQMLEKLATREAGEQLGEIKDNAKQLMGEALETSDPNVVSAFGGMGADGLIFASITKCVGQRDSALAVAVKRAFDIAKLDPANVSDWYILMTRLCWAHFGEPAKPGRKVIVWTEDKYRTLLQDVQRTKRTLGTNEDASALRALEDKYCLSYERLKTALREAKDPDYNRALIQPMYVALSAALDRDPAGFTEEVEAEFREAFCRAEAERIGSAED